MNIRINHRTGQREFKLNKTELTTLERARAILLEVARFSQAGDTFDPATNAADNITETLRLLEAE